MSESAAESSTSYRSNYEEHKKRLFRLIEDIIEELDAFQKWAAIEDDAVNVARDYSDPIYDKVKEITEIMVEKRKAMRALESSPDVLLYPESDDDSSWYESSSDTGSERGVRINDERVPASFSQNGREKGIYPSEGVADRDIPSALSNGKGKEPELPRSVPYTMAAGEPNHTSIDEFEHAKADLWKHSIDQANKMFEFCRRLGSTEKGKHFLDEVTWGMQIAAVEIQKVIGSVWPSVGSIPTSGSDNGTTTNYKTRTSDSRDMPSRNKGEAAIPEADPSERKLPPNKIVIPGRRSTQLPPRVMHEVEEEEEPRRPASLQIRLPRETRTRYNLRSPSIKKTVADSSRTKCEPSKSTQRVTKRKEHKSSSRPADRKRQLEENEDRNREEGGSSRNKKRRLEDEAAEKEVKKQSSDKAESLKKRRERCDESKNKEAKARKTIKRS